MTKKFDIAYYMTHENAGIACYQEDQNTICLFKYIDTYVKQIEPVFPNMVCTKVLYYEDTLGVKETGHYLKHGNINIGIWEYYNKDETLNHTENKDKHFPVTWEQLEQIIKDNDIPMLTVDSIFRYYDKEKDKATWSIIIKLSMEEGQLYVFDANTGEIINKEILDMRKEE